jgi:hypothetical protein
LSFDWLLALLLLWHEELLAALALHSMICCRMQLAAVGASHASSDRESLILAAAHCRDAM